MRNFEFSSVSSLPKEPISILNVIVTRFGRTDKWTSRIFSRRT